MFLNGDPFVMQAMLHLSAWLLQKLASTQTPIAILAGPKFTTFSVTLEEALLSATVSILLLVLIIVPGMQVNQGTDLPKLVKFF